MKILLIAYTLIFSLSGFASSFRLIEFNARSTDQYCKQHPAYIVQTGIFQNMKDCLNAKITSENYLVENSPEMVGSIVLECKGKTNIDDKHLLSEMAEEYSIADGPGAFRLSSPVEYDTENRVKGDCSQPLKAQSLDSKSLGNIYGSERSNEKDTNPRRSKISDKNSMPSSFLET